MFETKFQILEDKIKKGLVASGQMGTDAIDKDQPSRPTGQSDDDGESFKVLIIF